MSQNNNEIICTRISHPRELLHDTLQINHHEMIIFSPCVLSTAIRYQSPSLEKMNRTKIVKQIEIYRRMLKLTLQFTFASSIHEKPEEIENGGFTVKPIKCSPPASLRRNMKTQEFWICVCGKFGQRKSHHCNRDAIVLEKLTYLQKAGLENVFENDSKWLAHLQSQRRLQKYFQTLQTSLRVSISGHLNKKRSLSTTRRNIWQKCFKIQNSEVHASMHVFLMNALMHQGYGLHA